MLARLSMPLVSILVWAACLVALIVMRPAVGSAGFWGLIVIAVVAGAAYMIDAHVQAQRRRHEVAEWLERLRSLVDFADVEDDGHLNEWFDADEWQRIFRELERMPKGERSLRRAIETVDPDFAKDSA
jgi:hypothetical protein